MSTVIIVIVGFRESVSAFLKFINISILNTHLQKEAVITTQPAVNTAKRPQRIIKNWREGA